MVASPELGLGSAADAVTLGRLAAAGAGAAQFESDDWPRHDAMWPAALALRKFLLEHTSMRARPRSNKL